MMTLRKYSAACLLLIIFSLTLIPAKGRRMGIYKQIYPEVNNSLLLNSRYCDPDNQTCPLFIAFLISFGGIYKSNGAIPGVQIALDEINSDPSMLPGYTLHYTLKDSNCSRQVALTSFFAQTTQPPIKVGVIGAGCSVATEPTAEVAYYFNLTQISCVSSSPALSDREQFRSYFQMLSSDVFLAYGYVGIVKHFGWRRVAIITQDETLFTGVMDLATELLRSSNINYTEIRFVTSEGIQSLEDRLFDPEARIFLLSMYSTQTVEVICKALQENKHYPRYQFIMPGWYSERWWVGDDATQRTLMERYQCSVADREHILRHSMTVIQDEFLKNYSKVIDSGNNGNRFYEEYNHLINSSDPSFNLEPTIYAQQCYDATWTYARALNKTLTALRENETINKLLAQFNSNLETGDNFGPEDFTYNNSKMLKLMLDNIIDTDFIGLTGRIKFGDNRIKNIQMAEVYQYRQNSTGQLEPVLVAAVDFSNTTNLKLIYEAHFDDNSLWPGAVPYDGVAGKVIVTTHLALIIVFGLLSCAGMAFAMACLIFNFVYRNSKLIRLASSKLNYFIGIGAIILYINIFFIVAPTTDPIVVSVFCNLTPWLTAIGYSLCYGTILVKMVRVYYIFNNPSMKKKGVQDWVLVLGVGLLVAIDLLILIIYTAVERSSGSSAAQLSINVEQERTEEGEVGIITNYCVYICDSARNIELGVLYGYKMVLQIIALVLAFSIRKVKVKGLDDAKYIGAAIYVTSIVLAVIIVATYTLTTYINAFGALFSLGFVFGTTVILFLVFVPLMVALYKDPKGENIFKKSGNTEAATFVPKSMGGEGGEADNNDMETLKKRIKDLESELEKAKAQGAIKDVPVRSSPTDAPLDVLENPHSMDEEEVREREFSGTIWDTHEERVANQNRNGDIGSGRKNVKIRRN